MATLWLARSGLGWSRALRRTLCTSRMGSGSGFALASSPRLTWVTRVEGSHPSLQPRWTTPYLNRWHASKATDDPPSEVTSTTDNNPSENDEDAATSAEGSPENTSDSPYANIVVEKLDHFHIMTIGINRPEKRNCVDIQTAEELHAAFEDFERDESMYVAVFHGLGGNFSAGFDLEELSKYEDDLANKIAATMFDRGPMGPTRMEFTKPVIAAVSGWAVAGGLELALMCDMRILEESARIGVLCRRFGVPLIDGGTVRLPELIGLSRALDLILTGRIVNAKEALELGVANRVVQTGTAFGQAMNLARELTKFPQECMRADRNSAIYATFSSKSLESSLQFESEHALPILKRESIQGAKKFAEGLGKHGKFNVNKVVEPQEWQKELDEIKDNIKEKAKKNEDDDSKLLKD
ncbi:hypothetical protein TCAL_10383 [Tigriopus californicus]|uniref:Enoyl-CoA hydratase n=1 Tax=Tigriopus californicus TaxID=6832 RepID=A0A553P474_TIGCA|nr:uncharacterized protein LOC131883569 [Tigriopus californicus]XP_059087053.1 uncharacterized protein LOC131883569 [Tigriopus californicus]TRY72496.1 hypothetical protein TCAL_10383 [Tigriopus californicus]|eukprot:TCALIF_10383-PA protein Name:"Similar to caiD Carnitinyl-CoA dehydratase (Citrobacter koseri (strain ATCC BAA-895 / CDC 4225-83 / SGSC4696))" AED:0.08 eAED:0.08 QI:41/1/1/1/1/1/5/6/409